MTQPWIPEEVSEAIKSAVERRLSGHIEIHFLDGVPLTVKETRIARLKQKKAVSGGIPCPACTRPMEARDYGNLYICACGTKRTRAQLSGIASSGIRAAQEKENHRGSDQALVYGDDMKHKS